MTTERKWTVVSKIGKRGTATGWWLVDPDGNKVASFPGRYDWAARQSAAALNLTTTNQRVDYLARAAGYN